MGRVRWEYEGFGCGCSFVISRQIMNKLLLASCTNAVSDRFLTKWKIEASFRMGIISSRRSLLSRIICFVFIDGTLATLMTLVSLMPLV